MKVVGVGCAPGLLTEEAIRVLRGSKRVYGSRRAIEIARESLPRSCEVHEIRDYSSPDIPEDAVLLSTGDPMLAGLGDRGGEVITGISSLQLAFTRLRLPLARVSVVDGHARDHGQAIAETVEELLARDGWREAVEPSLAEFHEEMPGVRVVLFDRSGRVLGGIP